MREHLHQSGVCVPCRKRLCLRPLTLMRYSDPEAFSGYFSGLFSSEQQAGHLSNILWLREPQGADGVSSD